MKQIRKSTRLKKDFKRYKNQLSKKKLYHIMTLLRQEIPIPSEYSPHYLKGKYNGYLECHIEDDFFLIWLEESSDTIYLERIGSHSELFK